MPKPMNASPPVPPPPELLDRLLASSSLLLCSHANPDGDAIGTELGLARILRALDKRVVIWNRDRHPTVFDAIPEIAEIHVGPLAPAGFSHVDTTVVLECPSLDRTGLERELAQGPPMLNIDHHLGNEAYGAINWVDVAAPAVGEMVWRLAEALEAPIEPFAAEALYIALASDTGGFRFSNATPRAFETAAAMVRAGAEPERAAYVLWEQRSAAALRLLAGLLESLELHDDGGIATAVLSEEAFRNARATPEDAEGLIDVPRSIAGVEAVALLREIPGGRLKASLRSRGVLDVAAVANRHGGGGHRNAAGCLLDGGADDWRQRLAVELAAARRSAAATAVR
jgi:bifunctional oligoribonuclease and PAP phosphatase NrnA